MVEPLGDETRLEKKAERPPIFLKHVMLDFFLLELFLFAEQFLMGEARIHLRAAVHFVTDFFKQKNC